jgi:hypothetical protein
MTLLNHRFVSVSGPEDWTWPQCFWTALATSINAIDGALLAIRDYVYGID